MTDHPHADPDDPLVRWGSREIARHIYCGETIYPETFTWLGLPSTRRQKRMLAVCQILVVVVTGIALLWWLT